MIIFSTSLYGTRTTNEPPEPSMNNSLHLEGAAGYLLGMVKPSIPNTFIDKV